MTRLLIRRLVVGSLLFTMPTIAHAQCLLLGASRGTSLPGSTGQLVELDRTSGAVVRTIGTPPKGMNAMAQSPLNRVLYGVTPNFCDFGPPTDFVLIDPNTAATQVVGTIPYCSSVTEIPDMDFHPGGQLYGWTANGDLVAIQHGTGQVSFVGSSGISASGGFAIDRNGTAFLAGNGSSGALRTVNLATAQTTIVATLSGSPAGFGIPAMKFDPDTGVLYAINQNSGGANLVTINPTTGATTNLGPTLGGLDALAFVCGAAVAPPVITQQPSNVTVTVGAVAYFTAAASGAVSVQWQVSTNGGLSWSDISGATGTTHGLYTTVADNGKWFRAVFLNEVSAAAMTKAAILTVIKSPGDFTGDGKPDIVWQHPDTGAVLLWRMNNSSYVSSTILNSGGTLWQIVGTGDFDGDGQTDLVWQDPSTGAVLLWRLNGTNYAGSTLLNSGGTLWKVVSVADFSGDGKPDLLWQDPANGAVLLWTMDGTSYVSSTLISNGGTNWRIAGAGDFTGDGRTDIIWQMPDTGAVLLWVMHGATYVSYTIVSTGGTDWRIACISDYTGDGKPDLVWQLPSNGAVLLWEMNGAAYVSGTMISSGGTLWKVKGPR
jgi:hypothetical protein